jgi:hypothetical protein
MVLGYPDRQHGRLVGEVGIELDLTEPGLRRMERGVEQI